MSRTRYALAAMLLPCTFVSCGDISPETAGISTTNSRLSGPPLSYSEAVLKRTRGVRGEFGSSVAVDGDTAVVGVPRSDKLKQNAGAAIVFVRAKTGGWEQQALLKASDGHYKDYFGSAVAIYGETVMVGAPDAAHGGKAGVGAVYVFTRTGSSWTQQQKLEAPASSSGKKFGTALAISGATMLVGAKWNGSQGYRTGAAYIYSRLGTNWYPQQKLTASDAADGHLFGGAVAIHGSIAVIGAITHYWTPVSPGKAYIFTRAGPSWIQRSKLSPGDGALGDRFGSSVAISGPKVVVGSPGDDDGGSESGSAYVFSAKGLSWQQTQKLTASNAAKGAHFGGAVSIFGTTLVVGASWWGRPTTPTTARTAARPTSSRGPRAAPAGPSRPSW